MTEDDPFFRTVQVHVPARLARVPISAPVYAWLVYGSALLVTASVCAYDHSPVSTFCGVLFAAAFSFQFWTYATWRGLLRSASEGVPQ